MTTTSSPATCQPGPIVAVAATSAGALAGFESVCTCSLRIANTVRSNVEFEVRDHLAYMAAKAAKNGATR